MIYEIVPNGSDIDSSKAHRLAATSAGPESTAVVRSWSSSMLMALLGAVATIAFLAAPARAVPTASMPSSQAWPSVAVSIP